MPTDSISESVNFLGGMLQTPSIGMLCVPVCFAHYDSPYPSYPHINNGDTFVCPPLFKSLDPPLPYTSVYMYCLIDLPHSSSYEPPPSKRRKYTKSSGMFVCMYV